MSKKIVVFTVTGDQGGSVARYLLKNGGYEVVGVVRDPSSDKSKGRLLGASEMMRFGGKQPVTGQKLTDSSREAGRQAGQGGYDRPALLRVRSGRSIWCFRQCGLWVPLIQ